MHMLCTENRYVFVPSTCTQSNRSSFDEINSMEKSYLFSFLPQEFFLARQSDEVGKMKPEQKTKLKLKTIEKID